MTLEFKLKEYQGEKQLFIYKEGMSYHSAFLKASDLDLTKLSRELSPEDIQEVRKYMNGLETKIVTYVGNKVEFA